MGAFGEPKLESFKGRIFMIYLGSFLRISWRHEESLDISLFIPSDRSFLINVILDLWLGLRDSVASPIVTPSWTDREVIENLIESCLVVVVVLIENYYYFYYYYCYYYRSRI